MKPFNYFLGLLFVLLSQAASAIPLTATGDTGYRGDPVNAVLSEPNPAGLDSVWIDILFNPAHLTYNSMVSGDLANFWLAIDDANAASGLVSVGIASQASTINSGSGSLIDVAFTIFANAPFGDTLVTFQCHAYDYLDQNNNWAFGCFDYDFPPVQAAITVLPQPVQVPLPATLWLLALGLPALAASRARQ